MEGAPPTERLGFDAMLFLLISSHNKVFSSNLKLHFSSLTCIAEMYNFEKSAT